jgi:glycosyltransferase involved in cell wall biosynthesis
MKVLVVAEPSAFGGTDVNASFLMDALGTAGHRVDFWQFPVRGAAHYDDRWQNRFGEMLEFLPESRRRESRAFWDDGLGTASPDVIVLTKGSPHTIFPALDRAARARRLPVVLIENEPVITPSELSRIGTLTYYREWLRPSYRNLQRQQRLAAWRVSVSDITDRAMNGYLRWTKRNRSVIYPGIRVEEFYPDAEGRHRLRARLGIPDEAFVVGAMGRLAPKKRYDLAVRLFAEAALPDSSAFLLAGEGPERARIEQVARDLGVSSRVHFIDWVDGEDRRATYSALDCFLMLSRSEGLGMTLIEMLCCGGTVIATRCGGPEEVLTDPSLGLLVNEGDWDAVRGELTRLAGLRSRGGPDPLADHRRESVHRRFEATRQNATLVELITRIAGRP